MGGWLDILLLHLGEIIVAFARLVLQVSHVDFLVGEPCRKCLSQSEVSASVAADVEDQSRAESEMLEDLVEVAVSEGTGEAAVVDIAGVIVEDAVFHTARDAVVRAEVSALQGVAEVRGVVLLPLPVTAVVEVGIEVHMTVAELRECLGEHLEELLLVHLVVRAYIIYIIYLLPVKTVFVLLVVEEAVMLVDDFP